MLNPTEIFLIIIMAAIFVYEIVAIALGYELITSVMYRWATTAPVFAFALGVLIGHLFWPHGYWIKKDKKSKMIVMSIIFFLLLKAKALG
jgi:hypothetical protein